MALLVIHLNGRLVRGHGIDLLEDGQRLWLELQPAERVTFGFGWERARQAIR
jgi:hypothetical protein